MSDTTPPAVSEAMREAVATRVTEALAAFQKRYGYHRPVIEELLIDFGEILAGPIASEIARLTGERDAARHSLTLAMGRSNDFREQARAAEADLTRMRAETERLRAALEPFRGWIDALEPEFADHEDDVIAGGLKSAFVTFGDLRRARLALSCSPAEGRPEEPPSETIAKLEQELGVKGASNVFREAMRIAKEARAALSNQEQTDA